ncbi:MAG TPA: exodeoxyribonuclease VII large subunit, partial [Mycobacteriales bacterium]
RDALARSLSARLDHERRGLDRLQTGPLIEALVGQHGFAVESLQHRGFRALGSRLGQAGSEIEGLRSRVRALSPLATLERGYALALGPSGEVLRSVGDVAANEVIGVRLADGSIRATVTDVSVQSPA